MQKGWLARFLRHQGAVCGDKSILVPPYLRTLVPPIILFALFFLSSCRRDLWVYTDELRQVELITDWSEATEVPDGMTWWFMNDNLSGQNRHNKTSDVTHATSPTPGSPCHAARSRASSSTTPPRSTPTSSSWA